MLNAIAVIHTKPGSFQGAASVPVTEQGSIPAIRAIFVGHVGTAIDAKLIVDTGTAITMISQSLAERLAVTQTDHITMRTFSGHGFDEYFTVIPELKIGAATFRDLPVMVAPDETMARDDGILGISSMELAGTIGWLEAGSIFILHPVSKNEGCEKSQAFRAFTQVLIPLRTNNQSAVAGFLDSGASFVRLDDLSSDLMRSANPIKIERQTSTSLGLAREVEIGVPNGDVRMPEVVIDTFEHKGNNSEWIGFPFIKRYSSFLINLDDTQLCYEK